MSATDQMMTDIEWLSNSIGFRPALSHEEAEAVTWIKNRLQSLGLKVQEQPFYSYGRLIERLGPAGLLAGIGTWLGLGKSRWRQLLGAALTAAAAWSVQQIQTGQPSFWDTWLPQTRAHNLVVRIAPRRPLQKRVVFIAHLDTDLQRLSAHVKVREWLPAPAQLLQRLATLGATFTSEGSWHWLRKLLLGGILAETALLAVDEMGSYSAGANDNASGVALLLHLAETLAQNPLENTEIVIAFTSCDTLNGRGLAELVAQWGEEWKNAEWISVDCVGAGELCWINEMPDSNMAQLFTRIARSNPAWGIMGRPLSVPNPVVPLTAHQLQAIALVGYERSVSYPVHWQHAGDTADQIEPASLNKAWKFLQATLEAIDQPASVIESQLAEKVQTR